MSNEREEINLRDVLKQRIEAGETIYLNGASAPDIDRMLDSLADETGKVVQVVQVIDVEKKITQTIFPKTFTPASE